MNCTNCGTQLPQGANACPSCGTLSPLFHASAGSTADDSTAISATLPSQSLSPTLPSQSLQPTAMSPTLPSQSPQPTAMSPTLPSQPLKPAEGVEISALATRAEEPPVGPTPSKPATYYGAPSYHMNEPNPYETNETNPYSRGSSPYPSTDTPPPPPPPLTGQKPKNNTVFVVVLCVVLLALVSAGVFVFVIKSGPSTSGSNHTAATQVTPQPQATTPTEKQALYNQMIATTPSINDPLSGPDNFGWDNYTGQSGQTHCFFSQGQYHSTAQPGYFSPCYGKATNFQNFVLQVKMTIISGHSGGLVFRADYTNDKGYQFRISTDGSNNYILNRIILDAQGNIQSDGETLTSGSSTSIQQGTNQLAILAQGNILSLFINGKYVDSATDSTYHSGQVGVYVDSDASAAEGAFSNLKVWKLG